MKIVLMYVSSLDGKITKGDDPVVTNWSSKEDQALFEKVRDENSLIVMGKETYEAAKDQIKLKQGLLRVVLTHNPEAYRDQVAPGMLEFSSEKPRELVERLAKAGYNQMLLVGGSEIAALFFKEKLIDEVWLTIESAIFGKGIPLVAEEPLDVSLKLLDLQRLNEKGTLHVRYKVL